MNRTKDFKVYNEPTWGGLSALCPNIHPSLNTCADTMFVGKEMNERIGKWIKAEGLGGAFPWALNYDSIQFNNSLVAWLTKGMSS